MLIERDWRLDSSVARRVGEQGYPTRLQPGWWYPSSFSARLPQSIQHVAPEPLHSSSGLGARDEISHLLLVSASSDVACPRHVKTEQNLQLATLPVQLPDHLDRVERHARGTDARELLECGFFGPRGAAWA